MESKIGIYWDGVREDLESQEWERDEFNNVEQRLTFIGTVLDLYPSGKYYTPWANSNVDVCEQCASASAAPCDETSPCYDKEWTDPLDEKNAEHHCEVCRDAAWMEQFEAEAEEMGLFVTSGEGDPCDIFVGETREIKEED